MDGNALEDDGLSSWSLVEATPKKKSRPASLPLPVCLQIASQPRMAAPFQVSETQRVQPRFNGDGPNLALPSGSGLARPAMIRDSAASHAGSVDQLWTSSPGLAKVVNWKLIAVYSLRVQRAKNVSGSNFTDSGWMGDMLSLWGFCMLDVVARRACAAGVLVHVIVCQLEILVLWNSAFSWCLREISCEHQVDVIWNVTKKTILKYKVWCTVVQTCPNLCGDRSTFKICFARCFG